MLLIENGKAQPGVVLSHNESERFESRFVTVRINKSPSIMLDGMHDSVLGVWVAHGEGRRFLVYIFSSSASRDGC